MEFYIKSKITRDLLFQILNEGKCALNEEKVAKLHRSTTQLYYNFTQMSVLTSALLDKSLRITFTATFNSSSS